MSASDQERLLAKLAGTTRAGDSGWGALQATDPEHEESVCPVAGDGSEELEELLECLGSLTGQPAENADPNLPSPSAPSAAAGQAPESAAQYPPPTVRMVGAELALEPNGDVEFIPPEPTTFQETALNESQVEELILKYLLARGETTGRGVADQIKLPFMMIEPLLRQMKHDQMVVYRGMTSVNDYVCQLTDLGRERARRHNLNCTYYGAAPVRLEDYVASVHAQSLSRQSPSEEELTAAFADLLINKSMLNRIGPAISSGRGLFLYGSPGNGKTSIAERVTRCFSEHIWIPRALAIDGEIMRLYDPSQHEELPPESNEGLLRQQRHDNRWVRIRRPTIVAGGELTMENLEVSLNRATGISESPIQLKSNCGTLVIDDFGRQRMSTDQLLNRWIVPLEKRYDFLNMANGKKVEVPFEQLIVFATNLEPRDLVDEAFLRRIPYKVEIVDPTEDEFRDLFMRLCPAMGVPYSAEAIDYLIDTHYRQCHRPFRCCHPRDLLLQVRNYCRYRQQPLKLTLDVLDFAVNTYFAVV